MPIFVLGTQFNYNHWWRGQPRWDADVAVAKYLWEKHHLPYMVKDAEKFRLKDPTNWFKIALAQIYRESTG
jgi:hypothetical protein